MEVVEKEEVEPPEMDPDPPKVVEIRFCPPPPRVLIGVGGNLVLLRDDFVACVRRHWQWLG